MQKEYYIQLKELLAKLKDNQGHFIIENRHLESETSTENVFFCQLVREEPNGLIRFEAVSHYFNLSLNKNIKSKLVDLGFALEKKENYAKNIILNSEKDIDNTTAEIIQIFEEIYKVEEQIAYEFDDQIEVLSQKKRRGTLKPAVRPKVLTTETTHKPSGWTWLFIFSIAIVGYIMIFGSDDSKKSTSSNEIVFNSEWDASVQQVVDYLKKSYLNDPDSYKSVAWSQVVKLNDSEQIGFATYQVRHKYRAKNGFGGIVTEEKLFKLDYQGNIVEVRDWIK